jgi:hypothetical protein
MSKIFSDGAIVDWILALMLMEAGLLAVFHSRKLPGLPLVQAISALAGGAALLMALRYALRGAPWQSVALWLIVALGAHAVDLRNRIAERRRFDTVGTRIK